MIRLTFVSCPIPGCVHHPSGSLPQALPNQHLLKHHLITSHQHNLHNADPLLCQQCNIHICTSCPSKFYMSHTALSKHYYTKHHQPRCVTNSTICHSQFVLKHKSSFAPDWTNGLRFIHDNITPRPAECRAGTKDLVKPTLLKSFSDFFTDIIRACNLASSTFHQPCDPQQFIPAWERQDYPFVWLLFHAELLIFAPSPNKEESINECTQRCLQLLYAGHISSLWEEVLQVTSRLPGSAPTRPTTSNSVNKAAQAAADCDNFRTAYARATTVTPVATISPQVLQNNVKPLYPPALPSSHPHQASPPRSTTNPASPTAPFVPLR
jgi:hypothetical protein